jgi:hypothetical protein
MSWEVIGAAILIVTTIVAPYVVLRLPTSRLTKGL